MRRLNTFNGVHFNTYGHNPIALIVYFNMQRVLSPSCLRQFRI